MFSQNTQKKRLKVFECIVKEEQNELSSDDPQMLAILPKNIIVPKTLTIRR